MKYASIDIETTGLLRRTNGFLDNQIIEFGCVLDDLENPKPIEELPAFQCYFIWDSYRGDPYALSMHPTIFRRIAEKADGYRYLVPTKFGFKFKEFLLANGYETESDRVYLNVAGKNFGSFDLQFLDEQTDLNKHIRLRHRFLDVGPMYAQVGDDSVPGLETCLERAGLEPSVAHNAVDDAIDVIKLVRFKMIGKI